MAQTVRGYHGTTLGNANAIRTGAFRPSNGPGEWLGRGIYFFEASPTMAWLWAKNAVKIDQTISGKFDKPAIIAADIELRDCIDLFDLAWVNFVKKTAEKLSVAPGLETQHGLRLTSARGRQFVIGDVYMPPSSYKDNRADCQVINAIWDSFRNYAALPSTIRAPFVFGRQTHTNSFYFSQSHVQIVVIDATVITNIKIES